MEGYRKEIEITSTGMVIARVIGPDGLKKGYKFFDQFISTPANVERSCKKAHAWSDEYMKICERQECL